MSAVALATWMTCAYGMEHVDSDADPAQGMISMPLGGGLYGSYAMTRDASGTSWQPDSSPMTMRHSMHGEWTVMSMAKANAVYTDSASRDRGGDKAFIASDAMWIAQRSVDRGTLGLHAMLSLDPLLVGKSGYPLLFQTGESADGHTPLIDRQHPHDLFMELAASYSHDMGPHQALFIYAGLPGEPALGPTTYMHRGSGMDNPETPIGHHWFDATHVTFGVVTAGVVWRDVKLETSVFNGREPDENRYDIEIRPLDSWSARLSYNPTRNWATQVSFGRLHEPERLERGINVDRVTASVTYNSPRDAGGWQTTWAIARNSKRPGRNSNACLIESALPLRANVTVFGRFERVDKDELFEESNPLAGRSFAVNKLSMGVVRDLPAMVFGRLGFGAVYSRYVIPGALEGVYGSYPDSWLVFGRWKFE